MQIWQTTSLIAAVSGTGYALFHFWLWRQFHQIFPACRVSYPSPWRMRKAHRASLECLWRIGTSFWRRLPDVFLIGAAKGGTSALYTYLCLHPGIEASVWKESRFLHGLFGRRLWRGISPLMYRSCFPMTNGITLEADPSMCMMPQLSAAFIKWMSPKAKVILCCREPVSRALSMYKFVSRIRGRLEWGLSFQEVYDLNLQWLNSSAWTHMVAAAKDLNSGSFSVRLPTNLPRAVIHSSTLKGGHYAEIFRAFQDFGENLHLVKFSALAGDTERTVREVFEFLSLDPGVPLPGLQKIMPEDVMDYLQLENESAQTEFSEEQRLLENYYRVMNQEFADLLRKDVDELW